MGEDPLDVLETERLQPGGQTILEEKALAGFPASPLPR
jgi:hypothetical protein